MHSDSDETPSAPVMFCHDGANIYYPTGPGRVHMIAISALADCDGSDEDFSDSTKRGDIADIIGVSWCGGAYDPSERTPGTWPHAVVEVLADTLYANDNERDQDFTDCLEMWADWCDRDAARLDSLDGPAADADTSGILARLRSLVVGRTAGGLITLKELVEVIGDSQVVVAA
jgi:hypothetical protein